MHIIMEFKSNFFGRTIESTLTKNIIAIIYLQWWKLDLKYSYFLSGIDIVQQQILLL
jgi:hypothetical protein